MNAPFERLVKQHKDAVYRQMIRVCGDYDDAEDALSEALLRAFKAQAQLSEDEAFPAWLATIGRRVCIRMRRHGRPDLLENLDLPALTPGPDEQAETRLMKGCVKTAVGGLTEPYKQVYVLRELEGLPAEEVAQRLGISVPAVKSRLHRARAHVRAALDAGLCAE